MDRPGLAGRRRTLTRVGPGNLLTVPRKQATAESQRMTSDTTSECLHKRHGRLENTYKLQPSDSEKFESSKVEKIVQTVLESRLRGVTYDPETSKTLTKELVAEVHRKVKDCKWERYKLVCHVMIGQDTRQGIQVVSRCVWDAKLDNYACVHYSNKDLFAVAQCYGVYFE